ncbi:MAG: hypothetical protein Kow0069_29570 [Promethearchaeota archaeon]
MTRQTLTERLAELAAFVRNGAAEFQRKVDRLAAGFRESPDPPLRVSPQPGDADLRAELVAELERVFSGAGSP